MEKKRAGGGTKAFLLPVLLSAALAAFLAAGCATRGAAPDIPQRPYDPRVLQQLAGKTWILSGILFDGAFIPMEPAHSGRNVLLFDMNGTFRATTATLVASGTWLVSSPAATAAGLDPDAAINMALVSLDGEREEDPDAARFQSAYLAALEKASAISAYGNRFMLYDSEGRHILSFILNNPTW